MVGYDTYTDFKKTARVLPTIDDTYNQRTHRVYIE